MKKLFITIVLFLLPTAAFAAGLRIVQPAASVHVGDEFVAEIFLDTGADTINAFEGSIIFGDTLALKDIRLAGSVVPLWVSQPEETEKGRITFAGVLPGGYQGSAGSSGHGTIATLVFEATEAGRVSVAFGPDSVAYKNDGQGTPAVLTKTALALQVLPAANQAKKINTPVDTTPPEPFVPAVALGADFGTSGPVLVFSTQDKDSGIDRYELAYAWLPFMPSRFLDWYAVGSPHVLSETERAHFLYLRAVDKAGNASGTVLEPVDNLLLAWGMRGILAILTLGALFFVFSALYARYTKNPR